MTRRKVIFVNRFFYPDHSATSQILTDLAFDLVKDGYDVSVVTSRLKYEDARAQLPKYELVHGVHVHRVWSTGFGRASLLTRAIDYVSFFIGAAGLLWLVADRHSVVVAKTDPPLISVVTAIVARTRGATLVNWLQDVFPEVARALGMRVVRGPFFSILRLARNASLRAASTNVAIGERMRNVLVSEGIPHQQLTVIPNWSDGEIIVPLPREPNRLRQAWGLDGKFVVGYSGNLGRAHEFATFLEAAERLREYPNIVFLFIGAGAQRQLLEKEAAERQLSNVMFKPYVPRSELSDSLAAPDVHLVSLNPVLEGLIVPSKFYGIAAAARPTLFVGDLDGEIPRILRDNQCGYSVAIGDSASLAKLVEHLSADSGSLSQMGANARRAFDAYYTRRSAVAKWESILNALPAS